MSEGASRGALRRRGAADATRDKSNGSSAHVADDADGKPVDKVKNEKDSPKGSSPSESARGASDWRVRVVATIVAVGVALGIALARHVHADIPVEDLIREYGREEDGSRFVEVPGVGRMHYRDSGAPTEGGASGTAPPILLIHGTSSSLHTWDGWLSHMAPSRRVLRLDLPGFGLTGPAVFDPEFGYAPEELADACAALLATVGVNEPVDVAGNSLGGFVAWQLAARFPQRVRRLVLVDSAGPYPRTRGMPLAFRLGSTPMLKGIILHVTPESLVRKSLLDCYFNDSLVSDELVRRHWRLVLREGNRGALLARLSHIVKEETRKDDYREAIRGLSQPTLVLWGEEDTWIGVETGRRFMEDLQHARFTVLPGLGHVPHEEGPTVTAREVLKFLDAEDPIKSE